MRILAFFALFLLSCDSGLRDAGRPVLVWDPTSLSISTTADVRATNAGNADLMVYGYTITSGFDVTLETPFTLAPGEEVGIQVSATGESPTGVLRLTTNGEPNPLEITYLTNVCDLRAIYGGQVNNVCDLGTTEIGEEVTKVCGFTNAGRASCNVTSVTLQSASPTFSMDPVTVPVTVAPDVVLPVTVHYTRDFNSNGDVGKIVATVDEMPNDPFVTLNANRIASCGTLENVVFGNIRAFRESSLPYVITDNCSLPLEVRNVSADHPFEIVDNLVRILPTETGTVTRQIQADTNAGLLIATVEANVIENECPSISIRCNGATEVAAEPLDTVSCTADFSDDVEVTEVIWEVGAPDGSSTNADNGSLYVDIAGTYYVTAMAVDDEGCVSLSNEVVVVAIPSQDIHIQLVWDTPSDPNQLDTSGSDLDLHFLHPNGCWNTVPWDVFFRNTSPDWGIVGNLLDNPSLDIDDTNGAGPENINLNNPEPITYHIGVHYWNHWGFGDSTATVRIYIDGSLAYERSRLIRNLEFWHVASLTSRALSDVNVTYPTIGAARCP